MRRDTSAGRVVAALAGAPSSGVALRGVRADSWLGRLIGALARSPMWTLESNVFSGSEVETDDEPRPSPPPTATKPDEHSLTAEERLESRLAVKVLIAPLDRALNHAFYLEDAVLTLDPVREDSGHSVLHVFARALRYVRDLDRELALLVIGARGLDRVLVLRLEDALRLARSLVRDLEGIGALIFEDAPAPVLDRLRIHDRVRDLENDLDHARARARKADLALMKMPVDVSGTDLSEALTGWAVTSWGQALFEEALDGVVWDDATRWPPGLRGIVQDRSEPIAPGHYRVRSRAERDPHETTPV